MSRRPEYNEHYRPPLSGDSNPFAKRDDSSTHVVSNTEGLIAPSRLGNFQSSFNQHSNSPSNASFKLRPSLLSTISNKPSNDKEKDTSVFLLKPARLPAPPSPSNNQTGVLDQLSDDPSNQGTFTNPFSSVTSNDELSFDESCSDSANKSKQFDNATKSAANDITVANVDTQTTIKNSTIFNQNLTVVTSANIPVPSSVSSSQHAVVVNPEPSNEHRSVSSVNGGYVFGQNLANRVTGISSAAVENNSGDSAPGSPSTATDPTFTNNITSAPVTANQSGGDTVPATGYSLEESARDYQAKHYNVQQLDEIEVMTGEENEANVLQVNCKLFVHEKSAQSWQERGQGILRLNDMADMDNVAFQSRLVMRTHGSLKLILNAKIWVNMKLERVSPRTLRFTAMDVDDSIKAFLITSSQKDSESLQNALDSRIQKLVAIEGDHASRESSQEPSYSGEKRSHEEDNEESPKRFKPENTNTSCLSVRDDDRIPPHEESTDSSIPDPETEASSGSRSSSALGRSESD